MNRMTNFRSAAVATGNAINDSAYDNVKIVADSIDLITPVGEAVTNGTLDAVTDNIADILSVSNTVVPNIAEILLADDNAATATEQAAISTANAEATALDKIATNADVVTTNADAAQTAADRVQTGLDKVATNADAISSAASASAASTSETNAATSETNAATSETNASNSEVLAEKWAQEVEDTEVESSKYSAYHWAQKASYYATGDANQIRVKATETLIPGTPVKFVGYNAGQDAIEVAKANQSDSVAIGIVRDSMTVGTFGYVVTHGLLEGIDTSAYTEGQILYVDGTGALTHVEPTSGYSQPMAYVLKAKVNGAIEITTDYPKQTASDVRSTAAGNLVSTDVQSALEELDSRLLSDVPVDAVFTDTVYDDTALEARVAINDAKVSNVDHPLVETAVPVGAVFTDTIYDDSDVLKDADTLSPVTAINKVVTQDDVAALGGGDMLKATYDTTNNGVVDNAETVNGLTVETAVPVGALFTDTVYDSTSVDAHIADTTKHFTQTEISITESQISDLGAYEPADVTILKDADIGVAIQAYDVDTAKTDVLQTFTASQRGNITVDNDLNFDMNITNNFSATLAAGATLGFTNLTAGQSGNIFLDNTGVHTIAYAAHVKADANFLTTVNTGGTFWLTYGCDGTNVYITYSGALI